MTMLTSEQIHEALSGLVQAVVGIEATSVAADATWSQLGVDSLSLLEIVIGIEQELGVRIPDPVVPGLTGIADTTAYVAAYVATGTA